MFSLSGGIFTFIFLSGFEPEKININVEMARFFFPVLAISEVETNLKKNVSPDSEKILYSTTYFI